MHPNMTLHSWDMSRIEDNMKLRTLASHDLEEFPEYVRSINIPISASAEFEIEADIDAAALGSAKSFSMTFRNPYQVQRRKHKKKRINKKWAKRYGYVTKFRTYQVDQVHFTDDGYFSFEATAENVRKIAEV